MEELKAEAKTWSLASDTKLLEYLQKFSAGVVDRSKEFADKVDDLTFDVADSEVGLKNTFNEFLMLGNTQFIENRVYEDDDEEEEVEKEVGKPSTSEQTDPFPNLKEAFNLGLEALKMFYFEESPDQTFVDIYNTRPLPYIIGTKSYVESADAGLGGLGVFGEEPPSGLAPASATGGSAFLPERNEASEVGSYREEAAPAGSKHNHPSHYDYDDGEDDGGDEAEWSAPQHQQQNDDSTIMSGESGIAPPPRAPKSTGNPLKDMLNAQITGRASAAPATGIPKSATTWGDDDDDDDEESTARPPQKSIAAVFAAAGKTAQADDHSVQSSDTGASTVKKSNSTAQPLKGSKMEEEEDEDDEGDMFAANDDPFGLFGSSKPSAFTRKSTTRSSLGDLFGTADLGDDTDVDSLFGGSSPAATSSGAAKSGGGGGAVPKRKASFSSLFGDANDDSLFDEVAPTVKPVERTEQASPAPPASKSAGGYDAHDLFGPPESMKPANETSSKPTDAKKPGLRGMGASDLYGGGLFGDDDDVDDGLFGSKEKATEKIADGTKTAAPNTTKKFSSLFGDDDDSSSLFGGGGASKAVPVTKKKKSIFDDDDDEGGLFGSSTPKTAADSLNKPASAPVAAPASAPTVKPSKSSNMFDEEENDEDDDPFDVKKPVAVPKSTTHVAAGSVSVAQVVPNAKPPAKKSIFDDDSDEDDSLFSKPSKLVTNSAAAAKPLASKASSLFDEDSGDEGFLNQPKPEKKALSNPTPAPAAATIRRSAFDDDSDGDKPTAAPVTEAAPTILKQEDDDLPPPPPPPRMGVAIPLPPPKRQPMPESDEENDEDDDELFSSKSITSLASPVLDPVSAPVATEVDPVQNRPAGVRMGVAIPMPGIRPPVDESSSDSDDDDKPKPTPGSLPAAATPAPVSTSSTNPAPASEPALTPTSPPVTSPPASSNKRLSGGLANIMAGMDASKIIMPGMAPPKFNKQAASAPVEEEENPVAPSGSPRMESTPNTTSADGTLGSAALSRATNKQKRAPSKKTFTASTDSEILPIVQPTHAPPPIPPTPAPAMTTATSEEAAKSASSRSDLFGDDSSDLFGSKPAHAKAAEALPSATSSSASKARKGGLFGDDDENDDDGPLFGGANKPVSPTPAQAASTVPVAKSASKKDLFGDDDDDGLFGSSAKPKSSDSKPISASSASKGGLFDDGDSLFGSSKSSSSKAAAPPPPRRDSKPSAKGGLFGDDDDGLFGDDNSALFGTAGTKKVVTSSAGSGAKTTSGSAAKRSSLFGDDDDDPLFGGGVKKSAASGKSKGLFDD